jgi:hypothetical protein
MGPSTAAGVHAGLFMRATRRPAAEKPRPLTCVMGTGLGAACRCCGSCCCCDCGAGALLVAWTTVDRAVRGCKDAGCTGCCSCTGGCCCCWGPAGALLLLTPNGLAGCDCPAPPDPAGACPGAREGKVKSKGCCDPPLMAADRPAATGTAGVCVGGVCSAKRADARSSCCSWAHVLFCVRWAVVHTQGAELVSGQARAAAVRAAGGGDQKQVEGRAKGGQSRMLLLNRWLQQHCCGVVCGPKPLRQIRLSGWPVKSRPPSMTPIPNSSTARLNCCCGLQGLAGCLQTLAAS